MPCSCANGRTRLLDLAPEHVVRRLERVDRTHLLELVICAGVEVGHADEADETLPTKPSSVSAVVVIGVAGSGQ